MDLENYAAIDTFLINTFIVYWNRSYFKRFQDIYACKLFLTLNSWYSGNLTSGWKEHPKSSFAKNNPHFSRPRGRIFQWGNHLIRYAQDDSPFYGIQIWAFKIKELTGTTYSEQLASNEPVIR